MFTVSFEEYPEANWIPEFIKFHFLKKSVNLVFETADEILLYLEKIDFHKVMLGVDIGFDKLVVSNMMIIPVGGVDNAFAFFYVDEYFSANKIGSLQDMQRIIERLAEVFIKPKLKEKYVKKIGGYEMLSRQYFKKNGFDISIYD